MRQLPTGAPSESTDEATPHTPAKRNKDKRHAGQSKYRPRARRLCPKEYNLKALVCHLESVRQLGASETSSLTSWELLTQ